MSTLCCSHSRKFKAKISMFKRVNSYENLYKMHKTIDKHKIMLKNAKTDLKKHDEISALNHLTIKNLDDKIMDLYTRNDLLE